MSTAKKARVDAALQELAAALADLFPANTQRRHVPPPALPVDDVNRQFARREMERRGWKRGARG